MEFNKEELIKSPLNFTGGKFKLLPQILPLFPEKVNTFVDLFAGGCNVGINVKSQKVIFNDIRTPIIDMYNAYKNEVEHNGVENTLNKIEKIILDYELSNKNKEAFLKFKKEYNLNRNPLFLFILSCFSFSNYINFNESWEFNSSFGQRRYNKNTKLRMENFLNKIKDYKFISNSFEKLNIDKLFSEDMVYLDPPYLITNSDYNKLWTEKEEKLMLYLCDKLNDKGIKFAISNVIEHKNNINILLSEWSKKYNVHKLNYNYDKCTYQEVNKVTNSVEVLITNY